VFAQEMDTRGVRMGARIALHAERPQRLERTREPDVEAVELRNEWIDVVDAPPQRALMSQWTEDMPLEMPQRRTLEVRDFMWEEAGVRREVRVAWDGVNQRLYADNTGGQEPGWILERLWAHFAAVDEGLVPETAEIPFRPLKK
jgi:hypothetical protein